EMMGHGIVLLSDEVAGSVGGRAEGAAVSSCRSWRGASPRQRPYRAAAVTFAPIGARRPRDRPGSDPGGYARVCLDVSLDLQLPRTAPRSSWRPVLASSGR